MSYTFENALKAFQKDLIGDLSNDEKGRRFLKLRSLSRKDLMVKLFEISGLKIPDAPTRDWLKILFQSSIMDAQINTAICHLYELERKERRDNENKLVSELYKLEGFDWGGLHQNSLEKTIVDNYVKKIKSFDFLNKCIENELHHSMRSYVLSSWYNHWTSIIIEDIFKDHPAVIPAVGLIKKIDFFINNVPFDLKVTYLPEGYIKEKRREKKLPTEIMILKKFCKLNEIEFDSNLPESKLIPDLWKKVDDYPTKEAKNIISNLTTERLKILDESILSSRLLTKWLYENQGIRRFDASNRLFMVLIDKNNFFDSWKLKRAKPLLKNQINIYFNEIKCSPGYKLSFDWEGHKYEVVTDAIFIIKDQ